MISEVGTVEKLGRVLVVGLPDDTVAWLRHRLFGAEIDVASGPDLQNGALRSEYSLLVVHHRLGGPSGVEVVSQARQTLGQIPVLYLLDYRLDSATGRTLLAQMGIERPLVDSLAREDLASEIRERLSSVRAVPDEREALVESPAVSPRSASEEVASGELPGHTSLPSHEAAAVDGAPDGVGGPVILLVDAALDVTERLTLEASSRGMRVERAASIAAAREIVDRELPDAVLLDLALCNSGDEGLVFLEQLDGQASHVPVMFLAERDSFLDRVQAVNLGGRAFLPKTLSPSEILKAVTRLLQQLHATESRVLAVDSDGEVLDALRQLLRPKGIELTTLQDPLRFWTTLEQSIPDLLLVDVDLPRWSGLELCRVVRNDTRWNALPVLCLTDVTDPETVQRIFDAGADDFVSKPILSAELVTKVVNRLQRIQLYRIMVEIDPLTGVANRLKAMEELERLLRLARRQQQRLSLAILDLDDFKQINDRFGHGTGDEALRRLGSLLMRTFRSEDVVARLGGEEFIVGMYGMSRTDGVQRLSSLLATLHDETPSRMQDDDTHMTFSAGVAQYPDDGKTLDALMDAADAAQYRAKNAGKNRVVSAA